MKRIVLAEDHALIRDGLKLLLTSQNNWRIVGETGDGRMVCQIVRETHADLLLLDLDLPGCRGLELAQQVKEQSPQTRILVVTGNQSSNTVRTAMAAGVDGYMVKHEDSDELLDAIAQVFSGIRYVSKALAPALESPNSGTGQLITAREKEILVLIAAGNSSQAIAEKLNLSVLTVRKHRQNLMSKLALHNVAELTAYAIQDGLATTIHAP